MNGNRIGKARTGGGGVEEIVSGLRRPNYLALEHQTGRLVWTELEPPGIAWAPADGSTVERLPLQISYPGGVAVGANLTNARSADESVPAAFLLEQNYPNPFNGQTDIGFSVRTAGRTRLEVYTLLGQRVATLFDGNAEAGRHYTVPWNSAGAGTGIYIYRLMSGVERSERTMLLLR